MERTKIKISVAMIVKNEEAMLAQCLESLKGADEIVIVDTGSIDKTIEVAQRFTKNIHRTDWHDDFAAARNFAKSLCSGDWILSIDADEVLEEDGINKIRGYLEVVCKKEAVGIKMKSGNQEYYVPRLFKNLREIFFNGAIHEVLNTTDYDRLNVVISFGSSPAHALDPNRNLRILEKVFNQDPGNTRNLFYLGREYGYKSDWDKCIQFLERYVALSSWLPEKADAYFMMAVCYWNTQRGERARERALCAININANFKAPILLMAEMSFEKNAAQWKKMAETATNENTLFARENFRII